MSVATDTAARAASRGMNTERWIRIIAGSFVLLSLYLAHRYNGVDLARPSWLWFTAFVGANLLQSGITRWCLMESILRRLGVPSACAQADPRRRG